LEKIKKIYVLSGLGADKRVFQKIQFGNCKPEFINWIEPLDKESINEYSSRIAEQITEKNPTILGISFGGIVAQEIASKIETEKLILLATFEKRSDLPKYFRLFGSLKIDKMIPAGLLKSHNFLTDYFFGTQTKENSRILESILMDTEKKFIKWSLRQLATWKGNKILKTKSKITIHGTNDKIIPKNRNKNYNYEIVNGGHFFTLTHEKEINEIIKTELRKE
jgi:pimeloyl-ACP methyl ester carboxylesterase